MSDQTTPQPPYPPEAGIPPRYADTPYDELPRGLQKRLDERR